ncbi:N-acetylglucosamine/diacetylchitobiose ABC transporter substrate-binding protein [Sciscionella sediminilitoris]|uniref:N-acetylglucosamine/diacetylchitobiose ABC transporter substrate-binding protein n=1 Tax=Sciscionella sediminilitoris TaxID=1445613 RepID=UPI0004DF80C9|nr:N-acetylglucosamine/diacetylchitobiose ABC transporter substrate-binding protein [Sciscionella sp. SE31]
MNLDRRTFIRGSALAGLLAVPVIGGCATGGGGGGNTAVTGKVTPDNPLGMAVDTPVKVYIFDGGYGSEYATSVHKPMLEGKHKGAKVDIQVTKEINKVLQPQFAGGTPPDVVDNDGDNKMDEGSLSGDGQLTDLARLLDAPAWDVPGKKVGDLLDPSAKEFGTYNGKFVEVLYTLNSYGIWYSQKLFRERGWQVPKTWDEFVKLCQTIKGSGMAAYTYAGKYPQYQMEPMLTMAIKTGGLEVMKNIDNLEDGAWKAEPIKQAAAAWQEIGAKYLMEGTAGISHTESQTKQNNGQVAMLPCGSWIENEQKKSIPPGFDYGVFPIPSLTGSDKLPQTAIHSIPIGGFLVPAKAKNPGGGLEYLRAMLSKEGATRYSAMTASMTVVKDAIPEKQSPGLASTVQMHSAAGENAFSWRFEYWYKQLFDAVKSATNELMAGRMTPDAFCDQVQQKADQLKKDPSVKKYHR